MPNVKELQNNEKKNRFLEVFTESLCFNFWCFHGIKSVDLILGIKISRTAPNQVDVIDVAVRIPCLV